MAQASEIDKMLDTMDYLNDVMFDSVKDMSLEERDKNKKNMKKDTKDMITGKKKFSEQTFSDVNLSKNNIMDMMQSLDYMAFTQMYPELKDDQREFARLRIALKIFTSRQNMDQMAVQPKKNAEMFDMISKYYKPMKK